MSEEIAAIRGWVLRALICAGEEANKRVRTNQWVSDYDRGRDAGVISAYRHVLVETSPVNAWKVEYNTFNGWVADICEHTPLTIGPAIELYGIFDDNDMPKTSKVIERVIELWADWHNEYDIVRILKHEARQREKWIKPNKWGRKETK